MKWLKIAVQIFPMAALLVLGASCTKQNNSSQSPEGALDNYVKTAFNAKSVDAKKSLLELSEGEAKVWLESMSNEEFEKQFVKNNMQFLSMKTKDKREETGGDVSLVYELAFRDGKTPNAAAYTNKKIAFLTKTDTGWKIKATKNVKTYIERKDDLEVSPLTPETTDKNPAADRK